MANFRTSRAFDVIFMVVLMIVVAVSYLNRSAVGDYLFFTRYKPASSVAQLAGDAGLSQYGRHLFYRGDPMLLSDQSALSSSCDAENVGCISAKGQIFILDQPAQHNQAVVTAVHEMLHLAFRRLTKSQRADIDAMTTRAIAELHNANLISELNAYPVADRPDEAHSIIGSEYQATSELVDYYKQYFVDRAKVLAAETAAESQ